MMGFGMSLGMSQSNRQEQKLEHRQTLRAALAQEHLLTLRIQLLGLIYPEGIFLPSGKCPRCEHRLEQVEILKGFRADPHDTTTKCPKCELRFQPRLISATLASSVELPFYCELQTVQKLRELGPLNFEIFEKKHPAVLASARFYWGCLKGGFVQLGIVYEQDPPISWQEKVKDFLGKCPDTLIAEVCDVSASAVRRLRTSRKIPAYSRKKA